MATANLCKCNNCNNVLIDQNPQVNATEHQLTGKELDMQFFGGGVKDKYGKDNNYWGCPICLTDEFLTDI